MLKVQGRGHRCFSGCRGLRGFVAASGAVVALLRARAYGRCFVSHEHGSDGQQGAVAACGAGPLLVQRSRAGAWRSGGEEDPGVALAEGYAGTLYALQ